MGEINDKLSHYCNQDKILADIYNGTVYSGRRMILAEQLVDVQKIYHVVLDGKGRRKKFRRERDCSKACCRNGHFVILGIELQDKVNYCMPLRCPEYDLSELRTQQQRMEWRYKREGNFETGEERLSGIKKNDRLHPAVSIVLFHGNEKWNAAESLEDMLDMEGMDDELRALMVKHRIRVYNLCDLDENNFETGMRELIGLFKRKDDKEAMAAFYEENRERFSQMDDETFDLICSMLDMKPLLKKNETKGKEGKVNMCRAFYELLEDHENLGMARGQLTTLISLVMKKMNRGKVIEVIAEELEEEIEKIQKIYDLVKANRNENVDKIVELYQGAA